MDAMREVSTPDGLWEELEREATGRLTLENFNYGVLTREDRAGDIAAYLLAEHRPRLMTVHLLETDDFQHREGRSGPTVPRAVAAVDRAISQMVEAAARAEILDQTAFVVTGDHGFIDHQTRLAPNVWLVEAGLMENADDRGDWRATFHTSAASAFLHLADPADREAADRVREVLESRPANERRLFSLVERAELDSRGAAPDAVFALTPAEGVTLSSSADAPAISPDSGANHGHRPELPQMHTGFVGWGAGIRQGASIERMALVDVAQVVARLLGLDFQAPDGALPEGILVEGARRPATD
jgi:predicted AlkP superfamily pyrophosphatase or phosphodiesterase